MGCLFSRVSFHGNDKDDAEQRPKKNKKTEGPTVEPATKRSLKRAAWQLKPASISVDATHNPWRLNMAIDINIIRELTTDGEVIWEIGHSLGSGGHGEVFLLSRIGLGREHLRAVKAIPKEAHKNNSKKIARELSALIDLQQFPDQFVEFHGWYHDIANGTFYIAMEYLAEGDLHRYIQHDPPRARENCRSIITQILSALVTMHDMKICHRDLKPPNVLVASVTPLHLKLADFGISKSTNPTVSRMKTQGIGSAIYMAPELHVSVRQKKNKAGYTTSVDMWALGAIAHEVFTGIPPFCMPLIEEVLTGSPPPETSGIACSPVPSVKASVTLDHKAYWDYYGSKHFPADRLKQECAPPSLVKFIKRLMRVDPEKRPSAVEALNSDWILDVLGSGIFEGSDTSSVHDLQLAREIDDMMFSDSSGGASFGGFHQRRQSDDSHSSYVSRHQSGTSGGPSLNRRYSL